MIFCSCYTEPDQWQMSLDVIENLTLQARVRTLPEQVASLPKLKDGQFIVLGLKPYYLDLDENGKPDFWPVDSVIEDNIHIIASYMKRLAEYRQIVEPIFDKIKYIFVEGEMGWDNRSCDIKKQETMNEFTMQIVEEFFPQPQIIFSRGKMYFSSGTVAYHPSWGGEECILAPFCYDPLEPLREWNNLYETANVIDPLSENEQMFPFLSILRKSAGGDAPISYRPEIEIGRGAMLKSLGDKIGGVFLYPTPDFTDGSDWMKHFEYLKKGME